MPTTNTMTTMPTAAAAHLSYVLRLADNALILGQRNGEFHKPGIVQEGECLQWGIGADPPGTGLGSIGDIEHAHKRVGSQPPKVDVQSTAKPRFP